jgi:ribosomal protein S18 acetylase RimI-like enzyme
MASYRVSNLTSSDFAAIMTLEDRLFGGEGTLGAYYVRLCCDFFGATCFLVRAGDEPIGYLLSFVRDGEAYCTTLAILPEYQGSRAVHLLIRAFVRAIIGTCDACWFTVKEDNTAARALHAALGAREVEVRADFYGPGDARIVSRIDRDGFERLRAKYERLGFVEAPARESTRIADVA